MHNVCMFSQAEMILFKIDGLIELCQDFLAKEYDVDYEYIEINVSHFIVSNFALVSYFDIFIDTHRTLFRTSQGFKLFVENPVVSRYGMMLMVSNLCIVCPYGHPFGLQ